MPFLYIYYILQKKKQKKAVKNQRIFLFTSITDTLLFWQGLFFQKGLFDNVINVISLLLYLFVQMNNYISSP